MSVMLHSTGTGGIWEKKESVPAEHPELIWYALSDTASSADENGWFGRVVDWTKDEAGDVLIFYLDPLGNWNCAYYVIYRRNKQNMLEYVGRVFTGTHVGWFDRKGIELQEDGFVLTYLNRRDLPTVCHKFLYNKTEDFVIPFHDFAIAASSANGQGQKLVICCTPEPKRWLLRLEDSPYSSRLLRNADGSIYYLPESVEVHSEKSRFFCRKSVFGKPAYGFRWLNSTSFRAQGMDSGRIYTWKLRPEKDGKVVILPQNPSCP